MRLEGKPVSDKVDSWTKLRTGKGKKLFAVMVRPNEGDLAYLRGIQRKGEKVGVQVDAEEFDDVWDAREHIFFDSSSYHGIIAMGPDSFLAKSTIPPDKDVDGATPDSQWYACTADAVMEILWHYDIDPSGKHVVIVNRSQTVGLPLAQMMLDGDATVTVCHSKTEHLRRHTSAADIVVTAVGKGPIFTKPEDFKPGAIVIDVGMDADLRGDVDFEACRVENYATNKDVGRVTTSMLMKHVGEA